MSDTSAFAMQAMNKLIEENPQATNFRVRWGFSNAGQNSDYYEVYYLYHKNEKHFIYKDSWGQKEQTVLSYDNVEPSMIRDIASQRDATAKELRWSKNISERRVLEDIQ